jgi:hypothetical protein
MIKHKALVLVFPLILILNACQVHQPTAKVSTIKVNISSIGEEIPSSQLKYVLRPFDSTYCGDYLLFRELQDYVIRGINRLGLTQTNAIDSADYVFFFDYGISDPEKYAFEITEGIYTRIGKINVDSRSSTEFNYYPGYTTVKTALIKESTTSTYSSVTRHGHVKVYTHYILLSCFDRRKMNSDFNTSILWKMKADAETTSNDTRIVLPYLIAGSHTLFGKNTGKLISRDVYLKPDFYPEIFGYAATTKKVTPEEVELSDDELKIKKAASADTNKGNRLQSIREVNYGDILYFKSKYGEKIYGIVVGKEDYQVLLRTYPTVKQPLDIQVTSSDLFRPSAR